MQPPKPKLISYNAIANGSRRHTKKRLGTFSASGFWMILTCTTEHGFCSARHEMMLSLYVSILVYEKPAMSNASMGVSGYLTQRTPADWAKTMAKAIPCKLESLQPKQAATYYYYILHTTYYLLLLLQHHTTTTATTTTTTTTTTTSTTTIIITTTTTTTTASWWYWWYQTWISGIFWVFLRFER